MKWAIKHSSSSHALCTVHTALATYCRHCCLLLLHCKLIKTLGARDYGWYGHDSRSNYFPWQQEMPRPYTHPPNAWAMQLLRNADVGLLLSWSVSVEIITEATWFIYKLAEIISCCCNKWWFEEFLTIPSTKRMELNLLWNEVASLLQLEYALLLRAGRDIRCWAPMQWCKLSSFVSLV